MFGGWSPDSREFGFGGLQRRDAMPCVILDVETGLARRWRPTDSPFPPGRRMGPRSPSISFSIRDTEIWMIDAEAVKKLPTFKMDAR